MKVAALGLGSMVNTVITPTAITWFCFFESGCHFTEGTAGKIFQDVRVLSRGLFEATWVFHEHSIKSVAAQSCKGLQFSCLRRLGASCIMRLWHFANPAMFIWWQRLRRWLMKIEKSI
jgi:hypothetical protein